MIHGSVAITSWTFEREIREIQNVNSKISCRLAEGRGAEGWSR